LGLLVACAGVLVACAEGDVQGEGFGGITQCTAGQPVSCSCPDGSMALATCSALGAPGMCMCSVAGSGGMAGAGVSGIGGAGGLGGAGGVGGAAGTAGMMVMGGAGGLGGAGGVGGGGAGGMTGGVGGMAGGGMGGEGGVAGGGTGGTGGVPDGEACADAAEWDPAWTEFEDEVLRLTNEARAVGHNCDSEGNFGATDPLTMSPILRCSSRLHSMDMGEQGYFDHTAPDGRDPFERMADAGYMGFTMGENIAKGQQSPEEVVNGWLDSDGHCRNIMSPDFTEIGVGYWEGEADNMFFNGNRLWTQNFGAPRGGDGSCPFPPQFCN
jgi:uncharacterized protein YkwD